jgi:hypothetical protein
MAHISIPHISLETRLRNLGCSLNNGYTFKYGLMQTDNLGFIYLNGSPIYPIICLTADELYCLRENEVPAGETHTAMLVHTKLRRCKIANFIK